MKQLITDYFKGMKPLEMTEYLVVVLLGMVSVWSWDVAVKIIFLLVAVVVVRIVSTRHIGNPALTKPMRWALVSMAGFYIWQGITLFWANDLPSGWVFMTKRLPLLLLPLMLLCADTSYFTSLRRRGMLYAFTSSLVIKFFYCLIAALLSGKGIKPGTSIDALHHTYMALYLLMALGFLYSEWVNHRDTMHRNHQIGLGCAAVVLVAYIVLVASRTGIAGLVLLFIFVVLHQLLRLHNTRLGLIILFGGLALGCATYFILPEKSRRITKTFKDVQDEGKGDVRVDIYTCTLRACIDNLPFGTGIGDGQQVLSDYYATEGHEWPELNTHNIYFDSLLTLGLPGFLLLLAMLAIPTIDGYRRRDFELLTLMFTIAFCGLFESIISRQLGLMFIVPMWYAIASSVPCLQTGSTDSQ